MIKLAKQCWLACTLAICCLPKSPAALAATHAEKLLSRPEAWFASPDGIATIDNILRWQTANGDWPKNLDTTSPITEAQKREPGTFDNGATTGELRVLARAYRVTKTSRYKDSFDRGLEHILKAQYTNGGWPQYFPISTSYHRHITFNDGSMIRLMQFLRDVASSDEYSFLDTARRKEAAQAVAKGIECILECQIIAGGTRTVWCAQHDAETLAPAQGRAFEHPSFSGGESAGILLFLMSIETPDRRVIEAVDAGVAWFEKSQIKGFWYHKSATETALIADENGSSLWARFYDLESGRPIFSDRDGVIKYHLGEIGDERRNGYAWYGNWGTKVIDEHKAWNKRLTRE